MRPPIATYNDGLFARAVALGCCPSDWGQHGVVMWTCRCHDGKHGAGGVYNAITEGSLGCTSTEVIQAAQPASQLALPTTVRGMEHFAARPRINRAAPGTFGEDV